MGNKLILNIRRLSWILEERIPTGQMEFSSMVPRCVVDAVAIPVIYLIIVYLSDRLVYQ